MGSATWHRCWSVHCDSLKNSSRRGIRAERGLRVPHFAQQRIDEQPELLRFKLSPERPIRIVDANVRPAAREITALRLGRREKIGLPLTWLSLSVDHVRGDDALSSRSPMARGSSEVRMSVRQRDGVGDGRTAAPHP
jgi:hypothetical protein